MTRIFASSSLPEGEGEELIEKARGIIQALGDDVYSRVVMTGAVRLRSWFQGRLLKISFQHLDQKVAVLRKKRLLKDTDSYKRVMLKSSKSHAEEKPDRVEY